jgi:hypothetical protein
MWKTILEADRLQMTIWRKRIACWIPKDTNIHSEYVIIFAFPLQQCLHEGNSMLLLNVQGGSNTTGTNLYINKCKQSRSYLNHLVYCLCF